MDSKTLLDTLGLDPKVILDGLTPEEHDLLRDMARQANLSVEDLLAMCAAHGLTPNELRAADIARLDLLDN